MRNYNILYILKHKRHSVARFRKVTKKGAFPNEDAVRKVLYLRIQELYKKWNGHAIQNWSMVRNQLAVDDKIQSRILKYEQY